MTFLFCSYNICIGQGMLFEKIKKFIPTSLTSNDVNIFTGDLNRDDYEDLILRFKMDDESEYIEHFYILVGQKNGTYTLAAKHDAVELDNVDGTSFDNVVINNGYFSLEYTGYGNTSGSYDIVTFKYSKEDDNWVLHRQGTKLMHRYGDGIYESMTTQKDFGKVLFENYKM